MENRMEIVSIIVPVFNTAPYLQRCLESLLTQTYTNVEILAVDDGSTDESPAICKAIAAGDARLRYFRIAHAGVSAARNKGLTEAHGEYICFVDSDDWLEQDALETLVAAMEKSDADVVFFNMTYDKKRESYLRTQHPLTGEVDTDEMLHQVLCSMDANYNPYGYFLSVTNKLFRVSSLTRSGGHICPFEIGTYILEDGLWLMGQLPGFSKGVLCEKGFYHRVFRRDSATGNPRNWFDNSYEYLHSYTRILRMVRDLHKPEAERWAQQSMFGSMTNAMQRDARETRGKRIQKLFALMDSEDRDAFAVDQLGQWMRTRESKSYSIGKVLYKLSPVRALYPVLGKLSRRLQTIIRRGRKIL